MNVIHLVKYKVKYKDIRAIAQLDMILKDIFYKNPLRGTSVLLAHVLT